MTTVVWLREDLRLTDNPALHFAASQGDVCPVFIYPEGLGAASYWWLHHSLTKLSNDLSEFGITLILKTGDATQVLANICEGLSATRLVWNRVYSPQGVEAGRQVKEYFSESAIELKSFSAQLLIEPTQILTKQGTPFKVFTPFWRNCLSTLAVKPGLDIPIFSQAEDPPKVNLNSERLIDWALLPTAPDWSTGIAQRWRPGELGAQTRWQAFLDGGVTNYKEGRDIPSEENTSMLSPHLAFGEISPRQIWFDTHAAMAAGELDSSNGNKFLSEIGWREFSRYLLIHFPHIINQPFNPRFSDFPWEQNTELLTAWKTGQTGYPIVDAGMRELWHTGYMHNRVRMVAASFLSKHCLVDWRVGMNWFWDTLVDADIGNNTASWQWVAGCGADASPYFRIFNPVLQGEKFDKEGSYIKKWVPELNNLPQKFIHKPWDADPMTLSRAGVVLGDNYPKPVVEHKYARERALAAYQEIRTLS